MSRALTWRGWSRPRGPLPVAHACNYAHQAALGLQHAHEHGMVHRDIKPSNLMLTRQGDRALIKVLDFGLAKVRSEGAVDDGLTHEGQMLGTPAYIAPEQISDARRADIRADIYSLGCTLYYLLTGGPPFRGTSLYDILQAHHSMEAMPLNLKRPEVPVELAALVAKMMAKEPKRRFQEPKEVAQALTPFFKKGDLAFQSTDAEFSHVGQSSWGRPVPQVVFTTTQPVTNDTGPIAQEHRVAWPQMETPHAPALPKRPGRRRPPVHRVSRLQEVPCGPVSRSDGQEQGVVISPRGPGAGCFPTAVVGESWVALAESRRGRRARSSFARHYRSRNHQHGPHQDRDP